MISIIFEIAKWTVRRISQPSSVASLSAVLAYFGIQSAEMISENVLLGGEESGGIATVGHIPERDGIWMGK